MKTEEIERPMQCGESFDEKRDLFDSGAIQMKMTLMGFLENQIDVATRLRFDIKNLIRVRDQQKRIIQKVREVGLKFTGRAESSKAALRDIDLRLTALSNSMKQKSFKRDSIQSRIVSIHGQVSKAMEMDQAIEKGSARCGPAEMLFNDAVKN